MSSNRSQIVTDFLRAFMSGDIEAASRMVRDDFSIPGATLDGSGIR